MPHIRLGAFKFVRTFVGFYQLGNSIALVLFVLGWMPKYSPMFFTK